MTQAIVVSRPASAVADRPSPSVSAADDTAPIVRVQRRLFSEAARLGASDIHIEPGERSTRVRFRLHGLLRPVTEVPRWMHDGLVARLKILARLDISEKRVPQDGQIHGELEDADLRVSTLPSRWGEKVVLRLLRRDRSKLSLSNLQLPRGVEDVLRQLLTRPQGILLVVGPTGSGKTTTLYSCIEEVRPRPVNIVTIEDPVEYDVPGITQVQVNEKAGLHFATALRSILRQDPDVVLVGEIRDSETVRIAYHAALTGHLVLSSLHSTDSISALMRLRELGIEPGVLAGATIGVISQRLVRTNCASCAEQDYPPPVYLEKLRISHDLVPRLRAGRGCARCQETGAAGRMAIFELLEMRSQLRDRISRSSGGELRSIARSQGFVPMVDRAVELVIRGDVSATEAFQVCYFGED